MSLTTVAQVRALVDTDLLDTDLQDVIEQEEATLSDEIGLLSGPRTVVIATPYPRAIFTLPRYADAVTVTDNGVAVSVTLADRSLVSRDEDWWLGPVAITFTPNDAHQVRRIVIEMVRRRLSAADNLASETLGSYTYQKFGAAGSAGPMSLNVQGMIKKLQPGISRPTSVALLA